MHKWFLILLVLCFVVFIAYRPALVSDSAGGGAGGAGGGMVREPPSDEY